MRVESYVDRHEFILDAARGKKILDCGVIGQTEADVEARIRSIPQGLHWQIVEVARETIGTDYSSELVEQIQAAYPQLRLIAADMETVTLPERFDLVIMGDLIEHLSNAGMALDHVAPLLTPDGRLLITCPNSFGMPNFIRFVTGRFREGLDHVHGFSKYTLENLLKRHGFEIETLLTCLDRPTHSGMLFRVGVAALRRFPEVGGTLLVIARPRRSGDV